MSVSDPTQPINAIVTGLKAGGCEVAYCHPGFFSQEIFSGLGGRRINGNERTAFQFAYGSSVFGKRSVLTIKGLGLNCCADEIFHSFLSGVGAGLVVLVTDDTQARASQEFFDARGYFLAFGGLWLEPSNLDCAYHMAQDAFGLSEQFDLPVFIRLTQAFLDGIGTFPPPQEGISSGASYKFQRGNKRKFVVFPHYWREQYLKLEKKNGDIAKFVEHYKYAKVLEHNCNSTIPTASNKRVAFGASSVPIDSKASVLRLTTYPIPKASVEEFLAGDRTVLVSESGENYGSRILRETLSQCSVLREDPLPADGAAWRIGEGYKNLFSAINASDPDCVICDVGQHTVESTGSTDVCLSLGSAIGVAAGFAASGGKPICVTGDTAFGHGGYQSLLEANFRNIGFPIFVLDNGGSQSTGGQAVGLDIRDLPNGIDEISLEYAKAGESEYIASIKRGISGRKPLVIFVKK